MSGCVRAWVRVLDNNGMSSKGLGGMGQENISMNESGVKTFARRVLL